MWRLFVQFITCFHYGLSTGASPYVSRRSLSVNGFAHTTFTAGYTGIDDSALTLSFSDRKSNHEASRDDEFVWSAVA